MNKEEYKKLIEEGKRLDEEAEEVIKENKRLWNIK